MITRRAFVGVIASGLLRRRTAVEAAEVEQDSLELTIANDTDYRGDSIRFYVVGTDLATGRASYVSAGGELTACRLADNGDGGFTEYGIPLERSGVTRLTIPRMSGRVYFSIGEKLRIKVVEAGQTGGVGLQMPAGWVQSDPNYDILHDWIEFTFDQHGMHCNTTMVDMFSIPLAIRLIGNRDQSAGQLALGGRGKIFAALAAQPDFRGLIVRRDLRVVAPGHGLDSGEFSSTYLDPYIAECWNHYQSHDLTVSNDVFKSFTGRVNAATERFDFAQSGKVVASFALPTTRDVLFCDGALAAPNNVAGAIAAVLAAALNRTALREIAQQPATDASKFYRGKLTNHYSRVMHEHSRDGRAYGFAFDDVAGCASYISDPEPRSLAITLGPLAKV